MGTCWTVTTGDATKHKKRNVIEQFTPPPPPHPLPSDLESVEHDKNLFYVKK